VLLCTDTVGAIALIGFHCLREHICDQPGNAMPGFSIRRPGLDAASGWGIVSE
jgi:hypothetical protein